MGYEERINFISPYERSLLSLSIKDSSILTEIRQKINQDYFLYLPNKIIFTCICLLTDNPVVQDIDLDTLLIECEAKGFNKTEVGSEYIVMLYQTGVNSDNLDYYLGKVIDSYKKYSLNVELKRSLDLLEKNSITDENSLSSSDLINKVASEITKLSLEEEKENEVISFKSRVRDFVIERANSETLIQGLPTGIESLDIAIDGLKPGTLTVIAGKAKAGKSAVLMNIADYIAIENENPIPVLVISTEMYTEEDLARNLSMRSQVLERRILHGQAWNDEEERKYLEAAIYQIENSDIYHKYMPAFNAESLKNLIYYCKFKYNIGLVVFDYIKLDTTSSDSLVAQRREDQIIGDLTNTLKISAGQLKIPVLAACQINNRSDMVADSDRIVRFCNTLIEFRAKSPEEIETQVPIEEYGTHWLKVTYSRGGGNKRVPITFYKPCLKIIEAKSFQQEGESDILDPAQKLVSPRQTEKDKINKFKKNFCNIPQGQSDSLDLLDTNLKEDDLF